MSSDIQVYTEFDTFITCDVQDREAVNDRIPVSAL